MRPQSLLDALVGASLKRRIHRVLATSSFFLLVGMASTPVAMASNLQAMLSNLVTSDGLNTSKSCFSALHRWQNLQLSPSLHPTLRSKRHGIFPWLQGFMLKLAYFSLIRKGNKKLVVTSASLLVTSALLVVTRTLLGSCLVWVRRRERKEREATSNKCHASINRCLT